MEFGVARKVEERSRFASARAARLATVDETGAPHLVPMVFALAGDVIHSAVDAKPKRHRRSAAAVQLGD